MFAKQAQNGVHCVRIIRQYQKEKELDIKILIVARAGRIFDIRIQITML